tara:strand:+ start:1729 stop:2733 length:1005 start_codon:yes stop_codon:yes gene_type:complete
MKHCTINDKWTYNGMKVVYLENEFLKIGILVDRGSDIFQFTYKPTATDLLLKLDKDILNPNDITTQMRDTNNQFEDYYYGGWQEILPNTPAMHYRNASLGQHGEVSLIPWNYAILHNSEEEVKLKVWTRPLRYPILIEKTLSIKRGDTKLYIEETLSNESDTKLHLMWGHHIAFGIPFLKNGATIETSASKFIAKGAVSKTSIYTQDIVQDWPIVQATDGKSVDASIIEKLPSKNFADMAFLTNFKEEAFYKIKTDTMSFSLHWDKNVFKNLWYWQERYAEQNSPWWGKTYAVALEPWSSDWHPNPDQNFKEKEWLKLEPREILNTSLHTDCSS